MQKLDRVIATNLGATPRFHGLRADGVHVHRRFGFWTKLLVLLQQDVIIDDVEVPLRSVVASGAARFIASEGSHPETERRVFKSTQRHREKVLVTQRFNSRLHRYNHIHRLQY